MSSPRVATAQKFLESFGHLDIEALRSLVGPNFTYTFAPSSIGIPPAKDFESWFGRIGQISGLLKAYPVKIKQLVDCGDAENKVVIYAEGQAQFKDEVMDDGIPKEEWVYDGEYMIIFTMNADAKIVEVLEFLDSKAGERFRMLMQRAGGNLKKRMGAQ